MIDEVVLRRQRLAVLGHIQAEAMASPGRTRAAVRENAIARRAAVAELRRSGVPAWRIARHLGISRARMSQLSKE